ncbi:hypothetical protein Glove_117g510 [Diversispora epigaea]|uniref:Uncharacterized protein n=1 Tax=Diversispora epigaea TaxID=1348612 RepID=A0A397J140_9GLOM|nr:hypothetical protein Glove_117g510 [Diversispora epigaea]
MPRAKRNKNLFASAIAGSTSSGSTTSRRTRLRTNPSEPYLVEEERATTTTRMETTKRNKNLFASAIAGSTSSGSTTSRRTRLRTNPSEPYLVEEERATTTTRMETNSINRLIRKFELFEKKMNSLLNDNADIKKRLKNIELLIEINNDPDFSKDVINRVAKNIFKANIFPSTKDLVDETEHVIRKNFLDISESMDLRHHSKLFKRIKAKLLEKLRGMRGRIASRVKSAIFEIFGEFQLPRIDFQSSPAEINLWKSDQRVKDAYRKLFDIFSKDRTYVQVILKRVWKSKKRISNMHIAWGVAIAQLFLNPDVKGIMISENLLKKQIKINFRKLQQKRPLKPEEGELDVEETSEEESEEEEKEGKSPKRRKTSRGHVPSSGRAPSPGCVSPPLTSPSRLLPEFFDNEGEGRQRAREEGWRESRQRSGEEEGNTTGGDTECAKIVAEQ